MGRKMGLLEGEYLAGVCNYWQCNDRECITRLAVYPSNLDCCKKTQGGEQEGNLGRRVNIHYTWSLFFSAGIGAGEIKGNLQY